MATQAKSPVGIEFKITGGDDLFIRHLFLDFNGTLALDGKLLPGVKSRLLRLAKYLEISVLTGDTFGTARETFKGLPIKVTVVQRGHEKKTAVSVRRGSVVIGNGRNDVPMFGAADLGVAVLGPEGCAGDLVRAADIVVKDIREALDLLLWPKRLTSVWRP